MSFDSMPGLGWCCFGNGGVGCSCPTDGASPLVAMTHPWRLKMAEVVQIVNHHKQTASQALPGTTLMRFIAGSQALPGNPLTRGSASPEVHRYGTNVEALLVRRVRASGQC